MKIGILTFHRAYNYGAILQAYALRKVIVDAGYDCEIIDYRPDIMEKQYHSFLSGSSLKNIIQGLMSYPWSKNRTKKFKNFISNNLPISYQRYTKENANLMADNYDYIVVGSDQVWYPRLTGNDEVYFLHNIGENRQKISYAASMGNACFDEKVLKKYCNDINDFSKISVRERSLFEILNNIGIDCKLVPDPTILLTNNVWNALCQNVSVHKKKQYILLYNVGKPKGLYEYAHSLANNTGLPILMICSEVRKEKRVTQLLDCGVEEFLYFIQSAQYVVTNSFHCTVFSLLFHKKFIVETSGNSGVNNRISDLLDTVDLKSRDIKTMSVENIDMVIDWDKIDHAVQCMRLEGIQYLQQCFIK